MSQQSNQPTIVNHWLADNYDIENLSKQEVSLAHGAWNGAIEYMLSQAKSALDCNLPELDSQATYPADMVRRLILEDRARRAKPIGWAAVYAQGPMRGKIYNTAETWEQIESHINQAHQSRDDITLRAVPLAVATLAAEVPAQPQEDAVAALELPDAVSYYGTVEDVAATAKASVRSES